MAKQYTKEQIKDYDVSLMCEHDNQAYAEVTFETVDGEKFEIADWTCWAVLGDLERHVVSDDVITFINNHYKFEEEWEKME
jgi:hypothetical protein